MVISSLSYATTHHHAVSKHGKREESLASTPAQQLGPEQPLPNPHSSLPTTSSSFSSFFFFALFGQFCPHHPAVRINRHGCPFCRRNENIDKILEDRKKYYNENKDKFFEYNKQYRQNNADKNKEK
jgi:hypothetical protein